MDYFKFHASEGNGKVYDTALSSSPPSRTRGRKSVVRNALVVAAGAATLLWSFPRPLEFLKKAFTSGGPLDRTALPDEGLGNVGRGYVSFEDVRHFRSYSITVNT